MDNIFRLQDVDVHIKYTSNPKIGYYTFTHLPTKTVVAGYCQSLTEKDKYRLYNYLEDIVNETYCEEIEKLNEIEHPTFG